MAFSAEKAPGYFHVQTHLRSNSRAGAGAAAGRRGLASTEAQFHKLVEVISRSQLNYRELIDSLDHAVFTISLEGEIRVANRRFVEILGVSFQDLIGHRLDEFVAAPTMAEALRGRDAFLRTGPLGGKNLYPAEERSAPPFLRLLAAGAHRRRPGYVRQRLGPRRYLAA